MHAQDDRDQFSPPRPPGRLRAVALAVLVHAALMGALTLGVDWKTTADQPAVEAELWDNVPRQAAPADDTPPPPPEPPSPPEPPPRPVPAPPPPPPPQPRAQEKPDTREADIAIEREKKRLEQEKRERAEQQERDKRERERREKLETEKKERLEQERKERLQKEKEREQKEKQQAEQKRAELKKQADEKRKAEEAEAKRKAEAESDAKRKSEADAKRRADAQAKELERQRAENMRRMQGLAGATGGENAKGSDKVSSGPSGSYGGRVSAKVKPNIVYPDAISGNPRAVVEVRAAPDGTIVGKKLIQSSGNKAWDDAVLRALDKTETLPRDIDGRVPSSLEIGFRPQD